MVALFSVGSSSSRFLSLSLAHLLAGFLSLALLFFLWATLSVPRGIKTFDPPHGQRDTCPFRRSKVETHMLTSPPDLQSSGLRPQGIYSPLLRHTSRYESHAAIAAKNILRRGPLRRLPWKHLAPNNSQLAPPPSMAASSPTPGSTPFTASPPPWKHRHRHQKNTQAWPLVAMLMADCSNADGRL